MIRVLTTMAFATLALAGCNQETVPVAEPAPTTVQAAVPTQIDNAVISEVDNSSPASLAPGFDVKAFAGTYGGTLPCADCPGIDTTVTFNPEGTYSLAETWLERDHSTNTEGTWNVQADGRTVLLDPSEKDGADRWFDVRTRTEIRALDAAGKPIDSTLDYTLRRK